MDGRGQVGCNDAPSHREPGLGMKEELQEREDDKPDRILSRGDTGAMVSDGDLMWNSGLVWFEGVAGGL